MNWLTLYLAIRRGSTLLDLFWSDRNEQAGLGFKRLASVVQGHRVSWSARPPCAAGARPISLVEQVEVNLSVRDRGVELHGDLVLLNKQLSLPDGSGGHAYRTPVLRLWCSTHIPGIGFRQGIYCILHAEHRAQQEKWLPCSILDVGQNLPRGSVPGRYRRTRTLLVP